MDCFYSVKSEFTREIVISRSRFICTLKPVSDAADAQEFIKSIRKRYPAATHYCYAYIANEGGAAGDCGAAYARGAEKARDV